MNMPRLLSITASLGLAATGVVVHTLWNLPWGQNAPNLVSARVNARALPTCDRSRSNQDFLVFGGGGYAQINEISLEKNLLYFQRTLKLLGFNPAQTPFYFANGTDGQSTVRYIDANGKETFKAPEIPHLQGGSTRANLTTALQSLGQRAPQQAFLYFTGHGNRNRDNLNNNTFNLWGDDDITVQEFTTLLDQLPTRTTVAVVMAQCFSGSFANIVYPGGKPGNDLAPQSRCGFFATIRENPSVGCTPAVDEADYEDYSSSFFAGLSGQNRVGKPVPSVDYNRDGRVSYAEAHAFVKIDAQTTDLPVSTSEVWLQELAARRKYDTAINQQPITAIVATARPDQKAVVDYLVGELRLNPQQSLAAQWQKLRQSLSRPDTNEVHPTLTGRLTMELINIGTEQRLRQSQDAQAIATLERLLRCESGTWTREKSDKLF
jgi:hypothetical protein